jgi:hypothetical protein
MTYTTLQLFVQCSSEQLECEPQNTSTRFEAASIGMIVYVVNIPLF